MSRAATLNRPVRTQLAAAIDAVDVSAFEVPTEVPEADGTLEWESTTMIVAEVTAGDATGLGYTYGDVSVGRFIVSKLAPTIRGRDALAPAAAWAAMQDAVRNAGREGVGAMAISAVDLALWDLKGKLLGLPVADLLPRFHDSIAPYGSGGFCTDSSRRLAEQLAGWAEQGLGAVKIKVGRDPVADPARVRAVHRAVGDAVELMVDANGAYARKQALRWAEWFTELGVVWLEEPVSSDDLEGLRLLRDRAPAGLAIAAGEYGWNLPYFERMLAAGAVDVLQADVTRCGGITGFLRVDSACDAHAVPLSAHCAPAASLAACCAARALVHLEHFHDHVRIERMLLDGAPQPHRGRLRPDPDRPGLGIELRRADAARFEV